MWLSAIKLAVSTGSKIYANKQRQKEAMSQAALLTAEKWQGVKQNIKVNY